MEQQLIQINILFNKFVKEMNKVVKTMPIKVDGKINMKLTDSLHLTASITNTNKEKQTSFSWSK